MALFLWAVLAAWYFLILHSKGKFVFNTSGLELALPGLGRISTKVLTIESGRWIPGTSCVTGILFPPQHQLHGSRGVSDEAIPCPPPCRPWTPSPRALGSPMAGARGLSRWWNFLTAGQRGPRLHSQTQNRAETRFQPARTFVKIFMTQIALQMLTSSRDFRSSVL